MKIVCGSCGAKYSIADEKVQGKVFKIRCRKCSNVIVVQGTDEQDESHGASAASHGGTSSAPEWYVVIDGEQAGPLTPEDLEEYYTSGRVSLESYIWRDGMADWTPLGQVDMFAHLASGGAHAGSMGGGYGDEEDSTMIAESGLSAASAPYEDDATAVVDANEWQKQQEAQEQQAAAAAAGYGAADFGSFDSGAASSDPYAAAASSDPYGAADPYGANISSQDGFDTGAGAGSPYDDPYGAPAQAEMPGYSGLDAGFGSEPGDLYGDSGDVGYGASASLGGESSDGGGLFSSFDADAGNDGGLAYQSFSGLDSLQASGVDLNASNQDASSGMDGSSDFGSANDLVGSRNENSVLFSLSSLQQVEAVKSNASDDAPLTDGSGLIDIQSLAAAHKSMSGAGMGGATPGVPGSAPSFDGPSSSPAPETFSPATMSVPAIMPRGSHRDNKPLMIAVIALTLLLAVGGVGAAIYFASQKPTEPQVVVQEKVIERVIEKAGNDKERSAEEIAALAAKMAEEQRLQNEQNSENTEPEEEATSDSRPKKSTSSSRRKPSSSSSSSEKKEDPPSKPSSSKSSSGSDIDNLLAKIDKKEDKPSSSGNSTASSSKNDSGGDSGGSKPSRKKLGKADVQSTVRKYNGRVKTCASSANSGNLKGKIWVAFEVAPSGKVSSASIASGNFKGTDVGNCVLKVVRGMKFPAAQESTSITKYPFFI